MPASAPAVHAILTALVQQPCVPADVAQAITAAISHGHADAASAVFASLSGQGVSPQLTCLGNGFGIAWLNAVRRVMLSYLPPAGYWSCQWPASSASTSCDHGKDDRTYILP